VSAFLSLSLWLSFLDICLAQSQHLSSPSILLCLFPYIHPAPATPHTSLGQRHVPILRFCIEETAECVKGSQRSAGPWGFWCPQTQVECEHSWMWYPVLLVREWGWGVGEPKDSIPSNIRSRWPLQSAQLGPQRGKELSTSQKQIQSRILSQERFVQDK
jgi:hypothetical protein